MWSNDTWNGMSMVADFTATPIKTMRLRKLNKVFLIWAETSGYTRFQAVDASLAILGFFSLSAAVFNLFPMRPLDGAIAGAFSPHSSNAYTPNQTDGNPHGHLGKSAGSIPIV
jgi:Zn-dependent protease